MADGLKKAPRGIGRVSGKDLFNGAASVSDVSRLTKMLNQAEAELASPRSAKYSHTQAMRRDDLGSFAASARRMLNQKAAEDVARAQRLASAASKAAADEAVRRAALTEISRRRGEALAMAASPTNEKLAKAGVVGKPDKAAAAPKAAKAPKPAPAVKSPQMLALDPMKLVDARLNAAKGQAAIAKSTGSKAFKDAGLQNVADANKRLDAMAKPAPAAKQPNAPRSTKLGAMGVLAPVAAVVAAATVYDATKSKALAAGADTSTATADGVKAAAVTAATAGVTMLAAGKAISALAKVAPKVVRALPVVGAVVTAGMAIKDGVEAAQDGYARDGVAGAAKDGALAVADSLTLGIVSGAASLAMSAMNARAAEDKTSPQKAPPAPVPDLPAPTTSPTPAAAGFAALVAAANGSGNGNGPAPVLATPGRAYLNDSARAKAETVKPVAAAAPRTSAVQPSSDGKTESYQRIDKRTGSVVTVQSYKTPKK